ncbi:hypothetical protein ACFFGH_32645 [Lysobacter korlensis]|uniref:DUF885 domain-containing protein n=1 Tax=Lysobacter korlensis TaxID=553636 RepID=A0ABV6S398_9GAMM
MEIRKAARAGAWVVGGLLALAALLYAALLVINWKDEAPSAAAERMVALERGRPAVADEANGFVHALGLAAPEDADPVAFGRERKRWLDTYVAPPGGYGSTEFPTKDADYRASRSLEVAALAKACSEGVECLNALNAKPGVLGQWLAGEQWLLDRYRTMIALSDWRETTPRHISAPLPSYHHPIEMQKLHLLAVREHAIAGEAEVVRDLLERDLVFWRQVLASSDLLISKMIATAAVKRHFVLGNLALRELPADVAADAVPVSWLTPLTANERSMERALAGEWHFGAAAISAALSQEGLGPKPTGIAWLGDRLGRPLLKPQATLNLSAERMARLTEAARAPYPDLREAMSVAHAGVDREASAFRFYNPAGSVLDSIAAGADYSRYIARTSDIEGLRRAAVLTAELRAAGVSASAADEAIKRAGLRDPYSDEPFSWNEAERAVVFEGAEPGDRGRHALLL